MIVFWVSQKLDYGNADSGASSADKQREKLVVSDEYFQKVTQALIMCLRQHEEAVMREGR